MAERRRFRDNPQVVNNDVTVGSGTPLTEPKVNVVDAVPEVAAGSVEYVPKVVEPKVVAKKIETDYQVLNDSCDLLLRYLPEDTRELVYEMRDAFAAPLWQIVAGYVLRCRETGELTAPVILPDWTEGVDPSGERACDTCGNAMKPITWTQKYCCSTCYFGKLDTMGHVDDCALVKVEVSG